MDEYTCAFCWTNVGWKRCFRTSSVRSLHDSQAQHSSSMRFAVHLLHTCPWMHPVSVKPNLQAADNWLQEMASGLHVFMRRSSIQ
jgi:hypothetical protein